MDPSDDTPPAALRSSPSWLVGQAGMYAQRLLNERMASGAAHRHHLSTLAALDEYGPVSQASLGRHCHLDRSDVAALVGDLEEAGCLAREPDPADRRRNVVTITPDGAARLAQLRLLASAARDDLLEPLAAAERTQLIALVERVVEHHADRRGQGWA
ncbi:MarR family winged helix-turn-helix transcriptional regulator [Rhodococcus sp. NPDC059234]|uniref:MarR family winged helix-turn-helix transcriptional regulator n=1 Tax=Rhodococcus sp. NPDC059234 TaxID=3346781 RepID=UPI003672FFB0